MGTFPRGGISVLLLGLSAWLAGMQGRAAAVEPMFWRQRVFFIPYQAAPDSAAKIAKVQLLLSRDGGRTWAVLQEAEPHVRGFSYHAVSDGEYAFALRHTDAKGNVTPPQVTTPQLRVVVDTEPPQLQLTTSTDASGGVVIRYEATDVQVRTETLRLEAQVDGGAWQRIAAGPPDVNEPGRLSGQFAWSAPSGARAVRFRATLDDRAANQALANAEAVLNGPRLTPADGPQLNGPGAEVASSASQSLLQSTRERTGVTWPSATSPAGSGSPTAAVGSVSTPSFQATPSSPPPILNPFVAGNALSPSQPHASQPPASPSTSNAPSAVSDPFQQAQQRTPAHLVADSGGGSKSLLQHSNSLPVANPFAAGHSTAGGSEASSANNNDAFAASGGEMPAPPPLFGALPSPGDASANPAAPAPSGAFSSRSLDGWGSAGTTLPAASAASDSAAEGMRWVNALTFDVDYDLQTVGPWGVAKVELWATNDGGKSWVNLGADTDNRAPMRVTVPAAGVYGFRLVVHAATGSAPTVPAAGEQPELMIGVDLEEPKAELLNAEIGQANLSDHLLIRWSATDPQAESRPVGLFFSDQPDGPWTTIATDLENNGQYAWRLLRQIPEKLYLRLEVRDRAGNVTVRQSAAPVPLNLPQPTGRLRSVRPVQDDPGRYRTANGPRPLTGG